MDAAPVEASKQRLKLHPRQPHDPIPDLRPGKDTLFQPFVNHHDPAAIPEQDLDPVTKSAIIPHTKPAYSGSSIRGTRFLAASCVPAMAAVGKGQALSWSRTGPVFSEHCHPGCAIPLIVRGWTADRHL